MPFKHMMNSFRNKNGVNYKSIGDFFDIEEAKKEVEEAKRDGFKTFREGHPDGYWRVFVEGKESNDAISGLPEVKG